MTRWSPHADKSVNGVHRCPLARVAEGSGPGQGVKVVGVGERAIDVKEHTRSESLRHAGGSTSRFVAA